MSTGNYTLRKTYVDGDILSATDYIADHQQHIDNQNPLATGAYSDSVTQMRTFTDTGNVNSESLASTLAGEIERLRFAIKHIKETLYGSAITQWYSKSYSVVVPDGTVTNVKIADGAVTTSKLADNSVTSAKIVDGSIATADLADGSITTNKLANAAVTFAKMAAGVGKVATGSYVGDGNNNRQITGVGFQPKVILIFGNQSNGNTTYLLHDSAPTSLLPLVARTNTDPGNVYTQSGASAGILPDGFQLGSAGEGNVNTITYRWIALAST